MFKFIKNLFRKKDGKVLGALLFDKQELETKVQFGELVASANPVNWNKQLDPNKFNYRVRNQDGSSSCVAASRALIWSIMYFLKTGLWVDFSFVWPYAQRKNKPTLGMYADDALDNGMIPDDLMPSDNKSEAEMNNAVISPWLKDIGRTFDMGTPIVVPPRDIDKVASIIEVTGKPLQMIVSFNGNEWGKVPRVISGTGDLYHMITILPEYGMYEGEKAILIQDSWGLNEGTINGKRIIKESFLKQRNWYTQYFMKFKFDQSGAKPVYDKSVKSLQDCLKYEGCFPVNVESTGFFGNTTRESVKKFQAKYGISPTGNVGPITEKKLTDLFS